ncbi:MAG TPA: hypothetical protein GX717_04425, partial [Clostridiaceae bacterium]|nr:hypothetical protein [Clostridiaceae bacterium]
MKINQKVLRRILTAVVVVLALAIGGFGNFLYTLSSYRSLQGHNPFEMGAKYQQSGLLSSYTSSQLVQKILDAMRPDADVQGIYRSIPLYQLNGTTYEEFSRYVALLSDLSDNRLDTFSPMSPSSRNILQNQMADHMPTEKEIINNSRYFWLENSKDPTNETRIPMLIQTSIQGEPYLSRAWVTRSIDLYDFSHYYFEVLKEGDVEMLARLISSDSNDEEVRMKKARAITDYYHSYDIDFDQHVHVRSLRMDEILIRIELSSEMNDMYGDSILTLNRDMRIISRDIGSFTVLDDIRTPLEDDTFTVMYRGNPVILVGEYYESDDIGAIFGPARSVDVHDLPDWINYEGNAKLINVYYPTISVQIIGIPDERNGWEGVVRSIVIFGKTVQTGDGVHPYMKLNELLLTYPFIDINRYTLRE